MPEKASTSGFISPSLKTAQYKCYQTYQSVAEWILEYGSITSSDQYSTTPSHTQYWIPMQGFSKCLHAYILAFLQVFQNILFLNFYSKDG